MRTKTSRFAFVTSFVLFGVSVILFALSFGVNPWDQRISFTDDFHVGLLRGRIVFFNDVACGPYQGSIIGLVDGDGNVYPPLEREINWGDSLGVYVRYFRWTDSTLWTLTVSLLWPLGIFGLPCAFWMFLCWRRRVT